MLKVPFKCGIGYTILFFLALFCTPAYSQDVNGKWYGVATVENASGNTFMCELILTRQGSSKVEGYFNYYFREGYFTNPVTGSYNLKTRVLTLEALPILHHRTTNVAMGIDCFMKAEFTLVVSRLSSTLSGQFFSEKQAYTCPPLNIKFEKLLKEPPPEPEVEEVDSVVEPEVVPPQVQAQQLVKIEVKAKEEMKKRNSDITRILEVYDDSVQIDIYDNAEFDNDSISLFYNGKLQVYKKLLHTKAPITVKVFVDSDETNNDLIMFAENLGAMPPNAGLMIITDKKTRHEVHLVSNFSKNAAVRLRRVGTIQQKRLYN